VLLAIIVMFFTSLRSEQFECLQLYKIIIKIYIIYQPKCVHSKTFLSSTSTAKIAHLFFFTFFDYRVLTEGNKKKSTTNPFFPEATFFMNNPNCS
jgi:hypothetical protein